MEEEGGWKTHRTTRFGKIPRHLILHLKRFSFDGRGKVRRISSALEIPREMDLTPYSLQRRGRSRSCEETKEDSDDGEARSSSGSQKRLVGDDNGAPVDRTQDRFPGRNGVGSAETSQFLLANMKSMDGRGCPQGCYRYHLRGAVVHIEPMPEEEEGDPTDEDIGHYVTYVKTHRGTRGGVTDAPQTHSEHSGRENLHLDSLIQDSDYDEGFWLRFDDEEVAPVVDDGPMPFPNVTDNDALREVAGEVTTPELGALDERLVLDILSGRRRTVEVKGVKEEKEEGASYATVLLYTRICSYATSDSRG